MKLNADTWLYGYDQQQLWPLGTVLRHQLHWGISMPCHSQREHAWVWFAQSHIWFLPSSACYITTSKSISECLPWQIWECSDACGKSNENVLSKEVRLRSIDNPYPGIINGWVYQLSKVPKIHPTFLVFNTKENSECNWISVTISSGTITGMQSILSKVHVACICLEYLLEK